MLATLSINANKINQISTYKSTIAIKHKLDVIVYIPVDGDNVLMIYAVVYVQTLTYFTSASRCIDVQTYAFITQVNQTNKCIR